MCCPCRVLGFQLRHLDFRLPVGSYQLVIYSFLQRVLLLLPSLGLLLGYAGVLRTSTTVLIFLFMVWGSYFKFRFQQQKSLACRGIGVVSSEIGDGPCCGFGRGQFQPMRYSTPVRQESR